MSRLLPTTLGVGNPIRCTFPLQAFNRIAKIDVTVEATVQGVFVGGRRGFDGIRNGTRQES